MSVALHFGPATGEAHFPGRGLTAIPPEVTLFGRLITPDADPVQRPLATCSCGGGLALGIRGGTLQLHQAGVGWIDGRIPFPVGSWAACAVARSEPEGLVVFHLFEPGARRIARRALPLAGQPRGGDGVLTLNSRCDGASFTGAMAAMGLASRAWALDDFRGYVARAFELPRPLVDSLPLVDGPGPALPARATPGRRDGAGRGAEREPRVPADPESGRVDRLFPTTVSG